MSEKEINNLIQTGETAKSESPVSNKEAEEYAEARLEDLKAENNNRKKRLIKLGTMLTLTVLILVFTTIAWFSMNRTVETSGMSVTAGASTFNVATSEDKVSYEAQLKLVDAGYEKGTSISLKNKAGETGTYYMLDSSQSLILQCKANPKDKTGVSGDKDIGPGDWNKLNLFIVPSEDGTINATVKAEVIPFVELEEKDTQGNTKYKKDEEGNDLIINGKKVPVTKLIKVTTLADFQTEAGSINNTAAVTNAQLYVDAANYLKGHIMFFGGQGDITNAKEELRYYFTNPYTTRQFEFEETNASENVAYEVPLYWMWPNTLGQIALSSGTNRKGYPVVSDSETTEKSSLITYLQTNKSAVFSNSADLTDAIIANPSDSDNFKLLSKGYNGADLSIGTYISYFMIEITVEKQ